MRDSILPVLPARFHSFCLEPFFPPCLAHAFTFLTFSLNVAAKKDDVRSPWKCWSCAGGAAHWQHPTSPLQVPKKKDDNKDKDKERAVFIASDDTCELFYKAVVVSHTKDTVTVKYPDWPNSPP